MNCNDKHTPISEDTYNQICDLIENSVDSVDKICKSLGISNRSFYQYRKIVGELAEQKYARAKAGQVENLVNKINDLHEAMHDAVLSCDDPKRANAIVQAYRIEIDDYKWLASKLIPKIYGDKIDVTTNGNDISRELTITSIPTSNVSNNSKSTQTNDNDNISSVKS